MGREVLAHSRPGRLGSGASLATALRGEGESSGCGLPLVLSTLILRDWLSRARWKGGFPRTNDSEESKLRLLNPTSLTRQKGPGIKNRGKKLTLGKHEEVGPGTRMLINSVH